MEEESCIGGHTGLQYPFRIRYLEFYGEDKLGALFFRLDVFRRELRHLGNIGNRSIEAPVAIRVDRDLRLLPDADVPEVGLVYIDRELHLLQVSYAQETRAYRDVFSRFNRFQRDNAGRRGKDRAVT